jgi:hypothetical protein
MPQCGTGPVGQPGPWSHFWSHLTMRRPRVRWRKTFLAEVVERLGNLGFKGCPVCDASTDSMVVHRLPVLLVCGEFPPTMGGRPLAIPLAEDPDRQMDFAIRIECRLCGHIMLFNAEQYRHGDERNIVVGLTDKEEDALPNA